MKQASNKEPSTKNKTEEKPTFKYIWKAFGHAFSVMQGADVHSLFDVPSEKEEK